MNRPERFERSVDVLARAFFDGTLRHRDPCACAVGNLVADQIGADTAAESSASWPDHSSHDNWYDALLDFIYREDEQKETDIARPLRYTNAEIREIEDAFENAPDQFEGLMNVLDVLFEIHEIEDQGVRRDSREAFIKA